LTEKELHRIITGLLNFPRECEWIEFKENFHSNEEIGQNISALSNGACLFKQPFGYLVFGVRDNDKKIVGTTFKPLSHKKGNELFEHWLLQRLNPRVDIRVHEFMYEGLFLSLFEIPAATGQPIDFYHEAYIRVGGITRKLREFPEKAKKIWQNDPSSEFEKTIALDGLTVNDVVALLDTHTLFELLKLPYPASQEGVIEKLLSDKLIVHKGAAYAITNLGGILLAKDINTFDRLSRKAPRVIIYSGKNKVETQKEQTGKKGYASAFQGLVDYINDQLPANEAIESAIRKNVRVYPELAIRELVANALIHQDFSLTGTGPLFEIYSDRIEFTNPELPLIRTIRFIDEYQSRNEKLASLMRRFGICEEKGSGIDKVIGLCETFQLPAPDFISQEKHTKVIMYSPMSLTVMDRSDKIRACYQHCALKYVSNERMTNQTLRERFRINEKNAALASRIIRDTIEKKLVKYEEPESKSRKYARYVPFWA